KVIRSVVDVKGVGVLATPEVSDLKSPETYLGYDRAENFISSPKQQPDKKNIYKMGNKILLNQWGLVGLWIVESERVQSLKSGNKIVFKFHAKDLHLVLGSENDKPVAFKVSLDGQEPNDNHGVDVDEKGMGVIRGHRLYQLIRQRSSDFESKDHIFTIEFLEPGAQAFAFTFG
ncbi:MAG: hypothetical protein KDD45_03395, partial [Bdellovibrionales bacterium]|nr:hypothetical protein [Bdellovibrionales bacterium]